MISFIEKSLTVYAEFAWGKPLLILLVGGGLFFLLYSRLMPFRYFGHGLKILLGKYDNPEDAGDISHFQALSSALAGTIGMGNISGVAVAIVTGGPGAIFWMWVSAFVGIATKFFTCSLSIMYRGKDSLGKVQGGPMYVIMEGLGKKWRPLAVLFAWAGMFGCGPSFQSNQLVQVFRDMAFIPIGLVDAQNHFMGDLLFSTLVMILVASVVFGGIKRIGQITARLVPSMVVLYLAAGSFILLRNFDQIPYYFGQIFSSAFSGPAIGGGLLGTVIMTGIRRAAFSNEAGIGTEVMAHGAAKTAEPIREGLVAMLGPAIDTLLVCTATALIILSAGVGRESAATGVTLTMNAFEHEIPYLGSYILLTCVFFFSTSTMFTFAYYGAKCFGFLFGAEYQHIFNYYYLFMVVVGGVASLEAVINFFDGMYATMAVPTMISTLMLAPRVMSRAKGYFERLSNLPKT